MYNINEKIVVGVLVIIMLAIGLLFSIKGSTAPEVFAQQREFFLIDLNKATPEELRLLPYVSESMAEEIISYRAEKGIIKNTSELLNIKGIGPARLKRMKKYLRGI